MSAAMNQHSLRQVASSMRSQVAVLSAIELCAVSRRSARVAWQSAHLEMRTVHFKEMFKDPGVTEAIERANEYQLNDSAEFYFDKVATLSAAGYIPEEDDILRSRVRTTGIVQSEFAIKGLQFCM